MKKNFIKLLRIAKYTLSTGKRKISKNDYEAAITAYNEINSWFHFYKNNLKDENIERYIANHSDKVRMIFPDNKNFNNLKNNLGL